MSRTVGVAVSGAARAMSTSGNKINAVSLCFCLKFLMFFLGSEKYPHYLFLIISNILINDESFQGELFVGSDLSKRYAQFRPKLPVEHVNTIVELLGRKPGVWVDVGCGPGTSTQQ